MFESFPCYPIIESTFDMFPETVASRGLHTQRSPTN